MRAAALLLLALSACKQQNPALTEAEIHHIRVVLPGLNSKCLNRIRSGGVQALPEHVEEECFELETAKQWDGYWRMDFEASSFCASLAPECFYGSGQRDVWLTPARSMAEPEVGQLGGIYAVSFIGRRTRFPGSYGHQGGSTYAIIMDRILRIEKVEIPRSLFKDNIYGPWKPCLSAGNCMNSAMQGPS